MSIRDRADAFLLEIAQVCAKHGLSIGHEDGGGAFLVEPYDAYNIAWLGYASLALTSPEMGREHVQFVFRAPDQFNERRLEEADAK